MIYKIYVVVFNRTYKNIRSYTHTLKYVYETGMHIKQIHTLSLLPRIKESQVKHIRWSPKYKRQKLRMFLKRFIHNSERTRLLLNLCPF